MSQLHDCSIPVHVYICLQTKGTIVEKARGVEANVERNLTSAAASWPAAGTSLCAEQSRIGVHNMSAIVANRTVFPSDLDVCSDSLTPT